MSRQLVDEMKMQELQNRINGLELDQLADYNFYIGDLNYRLKTTYSELNNTNVREEAINMIPTHDQLVEAMQEGHYPGYVEQPITFLPSYKMSTNEMLYIDKKN